LVETFCWAVGLFSWLVFYKQSTGGASKRKKKNNIYINSPNNKSNNSGNTQNSTALEAVREKRSYVLIVSTSYQNKLTRKTNQATQQRTGCS